MTISWLPRIRITTLIAALVFGAIVHIVAIFTLPGLSENNAWLRVARQLPINTLQPVPLASPTGQALPYMSPDEYYALCRFDLSQGPVALRLPKIGPFWTVSLYDRMSQNYYVLAGRDVKRPTLDLLLNRPRSETEQVDTAADSTRAKSDTITLRDRKSVV